MKKILITILVVIIAIFGYNEYKDYKRFHPKTSNYKTSENIDLDYYNKTIVHNYFNAVENLNGYVLMQWSANEIDVKSPENDNKETEYAVNQYREKLAKVKYFEALLKQSKKLKNQGFNNADVQNFELKGLSVEAYNKKLNAEKYKNRLMSSIPKENLNYGGGGNAFVYEVQKLLVKKGYNIPLDGIFKSETRNAIIDFETKHNLFPDGQIDEYTLEALLE
ncbi:peptidoglycan-binding protein [Tamlana sp. 62-3]|uniref:Peptidoglycan-binding protein n=1 Tax=Neotamlana sargassicola TaxID=2883125 RepID=A0A9X1I3N0_9FLAO|nr:peptidoglycan-binding domain-containing protein [Tamlana sargassicola]MCB4807122.1 peptidoglycan-binding protein [Tamlana sargassicola]